MEKCVEKGGIDLGIYVPQEIRGWRAEEEDRSYDPQTIFDYINGAGEVYRSYNFKELLVRRLKSAGKPDVIVDFFVMPSSEDAFGVFTHDLEGEEAGVGQGATYKGGLLSFWKGHFFVSVYTEEENEETKEAVFELGKSIASAIEEEGKKPSLLSLLPPGYVEEKSVHYFHNHMILNYHFYVSDENILLLDQQTEAVLATGIEDEEKFYLLLVKYPQAGRASRAYKSFKSAYMPDAVEEGVLKTEDEKWTAAQALGDVLAVVFGASSEGFAREIIEKVKQRIE